MAALARQTGVSILDPEKDKPSPMLVRLLPQRIAERHQVIPLRLEGKHQEVLVVAIAAPAAPAALEAIRSVSGKQRVVPLVATDSWISAWLRPAGGFADLPEDLAPRGLRRPPLRPAEAHKLGF